MVHRITNKSNLVWNMADVVALLFRNVNVRFWSKDAQYPVIRSPVRSDITRFEIKLPYSSPLGWWMSSYASAGLHLVISERYRLLRSAFKLWRIYCLSCIGLGSRLSCRNSLGCTVIQPDNFRNSILLRPDQFNKFLNLFTHLGLLCSVQQLESCNSHYNPGCAK